MLVLLQLVVALEQRTRARGDVLGREAELLEHRRSRAPRRRSGRARARRRRSPTHFHQLMLAPGLDRQAGADARRQHLVAVLAATGLRTAPCRASTRRARASPSAGERSARRAASAGPPRRSRSGSARAPSRRRRVPQHVPAALQLARRREPSRRGRAPGCSGARAAAPPGRPSRSSATRHASAVSFASAGRITHSSRDRAQRRVVLDRLVRGSVLAEADRVVRPHPHDRQTHQRRQPHRRRACSRRTSGTSSRTA